MERSKKMCNSITRLHIQCELTNGRKSCKSLKTDNSSACRNRFTDKQNTCEKMFLYGIKLKANILVFVNMETNVPN